MALLLSNAHLVHLLTHSLHTLSHSEKKVFLKFLEMGDFMSRMTATAEPTANTAEVLKKYFF